MEQCSEAACAAVGFNCYTCPSCPAQDIPCPASADCTMEAERTGGNLSMCQDCSTTGCASAIMGMDCEVGYSVINRPACGIIEEVECPVPEYIKNQYSYY